ncbi:hypothetical protein MWU61_11325 [Loktanella sp. F6476L]|uniref:DUF6732 family protein n=1 Tax=Loktanella sp. F6476L TaxID=2926405 RepID=UPI001FF1E6CA|nr:DUF6732 family protein [Loktanella sp. F6476L]MCK0121131.1 hypothetical protein [Loktanella sp. F6476L]
MRIILTLLLAIAGSSVQAHPGHLADLAGHDHWIAGAAIGLAILTGIYGALKGKKETDAEVEPELEEEGEPA